MYISQMENRKGPLRAHCFLPSPLYSILPGSPRLGRSPALRPGLISPTHAAYHTPTLCQNGRAPHQPKRTRSVPAKTNQLCASQNGPALCFPAPPLFRLAVPHCRSFHRAGNLQPLRCRPPPLCRPTLPQLHRAGHLAQGLVCTGWPCSPAKCCTNPNSIS
jgi:hypothetical protein